MLDTTSSEFARDRSDVLRNALRDLGYVEGKYIVIAYRWAEGQYERLSALAVQSLPRDLARADLVID